MCCDCSKQECETRQSLDVLSNLSCSGRLVLAWKRYFRIPLLIPEGLYNLVKFKGFDALMFHHEHIYQIYLHFLILLRCSIISHGGGGEGKGREAWGGGISLSIPQNELKFIMSFNTRSPSNSHFV